ncbi:MAG: hypothetical protein ACJ757_04830 [Gaiellaceae bacterium]
MDVREAAVQVRAEQAEHFFGGLMSSPKRRGKSHRRSYQGPTVKWSPVTVYYREPQA